MPYDLEVVEDGSRATVRFRDPISVAEIHEAFEHLSEDGSFVVPQRLWDLRGCTLNLSADELRRLSQSGQARDLGKGRVAVLVDMDLSFGTARMYEVFRESTATSVEVFRTEPEALAWLERAVS